MGNYGKFIVTYKSTFWKTKGLSGEVVSDGSICLTKNDHQMPIKGPISAMFDATNEHDDAALVGFLAGDGVVDWIGNTKKREKLKSEYEFIK
jgi:hypothetical protein